MEKKIAVVIPVSPFEPPEILLKSVENVLSLDYEGLRTKIVYVVDRNSSDDRRSLILKRFCVDVLERNGTRGKRAGAINDAIKYLSEFNPDYVAIFDVDSEPDRDFIIKCVEGLERERNAYIASSRRYISNPINLVSRAVWIEYKVLNFLLKKSSFKQFNGLIGVLRYDKLLKYGLNEKAIAEDADFATRMHSLGYKAVFVWDTRIFEQAPVTWVDLFKQRKRWYYGGLQLWRYIRAVLNSGNPKFILSWIFSLTTTYMIILFLPLLIFVFPYTLYKLGFRDGIKGILSLMMYFFVLQISALYSILRFIFKKGIEWEPLRRV